MSPAYNSGPGLSVLLLTAVSDMIGAVAGRLARIIDRARIVEKLACDVHDEATAKRSRNEPATLRLRGRLANGCIARLTTCAFLIGVTIIPLFLGDTTAFLSARWAVAGFLGGIVCFLLALICFLAETFIATRLLNFELPPR